MRRRLIDDLLRIGRRLLTPRTSGKGTSPTRPPGRRKGGTRDVPTEHLQIEYSPCLDGDPDPGEVVWTWVPYEEDPSQGKDRPVIIIGRRGSLLLGVPLTSKPHDREPQVPVGTGPWDREGRLSYAKVDRLLEVDPLTVRREGAILPRRAFDAVVAGVRRDGRLSA